MHELLQCCVGIFFDLLSNNKHEKKAHVHFSGIFFEKPINIHTAPQQNPPFLLMFDFIIQPGPPITIDLPRPPPSALFFFLLSWFERVALLVISQTNNSILVWPFNLIYFIIV
jgi:hypothetical protein